MEIIRHKTKKVISMIMVTLLLINVCMPILATDLSNVGIGDTIKFTGSSWSYYSSKEDAKNRKNVKGYLKKDDTFDVKEKSDNVLKIENNKYIRYSSDYFTVTKKAENKTHNKDINIDYGAISSIGGAVIGGMIDFATSEHTWNILKYIGEIIAKVIGKILESFCGFGDLAFEFPKTEVPEYEKTGASGGSTGDEKGAVNEYGSSGVIYNSSFATETKTPEELGLNYTKVTGVKTTNYCACRVCNESDDETTATGISLEPYKKIVAIWTGGSFAEYGDWIYIPGWGYALAADCGGFGVSNPSKHLDCFVGRPEDVIDDGLGNYSAAIRPCINKSRGSWDRAPGTKTGLTVYLIKKADANAFIKANY